MVTMVVNMFLGIFADLVVTRLAVVIVMIGTSVAAVPSYISPQVSVTGGTLESLGIPMIVLLLFLGIYSL